MLQESHPKIALALKSSKSIGLDLRNILLFDNQLTFNLCCNRKFVNLVRKAMHALNVTSNGGGLKITEQCKIPGYKFWVWFSENAITNIICLKNLIKIYRVTYDSKVDRTFVVHCSAFGSPDLLFEMHPCGLHACYPKNVRPSFTTSISTCVLLLVAKESLTKVYNEGSLGRIMSRNMLLIKPLL